MRFSTVAGVSVITGLACFLLAFMFANERERGLLGNSLVLVLWVEVLTIPLAFFLAILFTRTELCKSYILKSLLLSLLFLPLYLILCGYDAAFGTLGWFTLSWGNRSEPYLSGFRAAIIIHALHSIPWATLSLLLFMRQGERVLEEQALLVYSPCQVFLRVTLPQCLPACAVTALILFFMIVCEMTVTNIYLVRTYAEEIYSFFAKNGSLELATVHMTPLVLCCVGLSCCMLPIVGSVRLHSEENRAYIWSLGKWRLPLYCVTLCFIALLILFPLINLTIQAGMQVSSNHGQVQRVWSVVKFMNIVKQTPWQFAREFETSALLSFCVAFVSLIVGCGLAWKSYYQSNYARVCFLLFALALAMSPTLISVAVIQLLNQPTLPQLTWLYDKTLLAPIIAMSCRTIPFAFLVCYWGWQTLPVPLLQSATLEGANPLQLFWRVALPLRKNMLLGLGVLIFALTGGDVATTLLVLPPGCTTLAQRTFSLVHSSVNDQLAGLGLWSWLVFSALAALYFAITSNQARQRIS
jgi:iron(III) transport system permease protein